MHLRREVLLLKAPQPCVAAPVSLVATLKMGVEYDEKGLAIQDLSKLDVPSLTPLSPEVLPRDRSGRVSDCGNAAMSAGFGIEFIAAFGIDSSD